MERGATSLNEVLIEKNRKLRRVLLHGLVGALAGYFILHPLSMLIHNSFYEHESSLLHFLVVSFSLEHLTMAIYFTGLGAIAGMMQGSYTHRLRMLYEHARSLSVTDELTLLNNRRYFLDELQKEIKRTDRSGMPLSLMMIDIDKFKQYNDTYGHPAGDELLRAFSQHLNSKLRETDFVARYGGEEFTVIMPETAGDQACRIAERLRAGTQKDFPAGDEPSFNGGITLSIGVAQFRTDAGNPQQFIASADRALYQAKHLGRNRVCLAGEPDQDMQEVRI
jgi:diguanylate cyclase (GGDEF)-like protein